MNNTVDNIIKSYSPKDELLFSAIGGIGEIGMNFYIYGTQGKWIIVDLGITFGNDDTPGIDIILPNPEFIKKNKKDLLGIIITHAHEDHIGAVPYLWSQLECPVYSTPFASAILKRKITELKIKKNFVKTISLDSTLKLGPFTIDIISTTHSIPEPNAIAIKTKFGNILHTGDWKIDPNPLVGKSFNTKKLQNFGNNGVLAIVSDSTNANVNGHSRSEQTLRESLVKIVSQLKNRVAITSFASNLARVETFGYVAEKTGRVAALCGRSLWTMYQAALDTGYLKKTRPFLDEKEIIGLPKDQTLLICTGSQGEPRAAMSRISKDEHQNIFLEEGDTVIFSSKVIPGNETSIMKVQNSLRERNINIITETDKFVHVSGHPHREELKKMYSWIKPSIVIPVHGEYHHLKGNIEVAKECGIKKGLILKNGLLVKLAPDKPKVLGSVTTGKLILDGKNIIPLNEEAIKHRKKMLYNGTLLISLAIDIKKKISTKPIISSKGFFNDEVIKIFKNDFNKSIFKLIKNSIRGHKIKENEIRDKIESYCRKFFKRKLNTRPVFEIHIIKI
ncbi:MAG: Ribonuclease J1 [Alphaproteobacteria bacterium MarineAlpha6_Bin2]|nr:MAG: Ribonuclease J1 [Alphaproteobacteria bacterium MarineAlpha6_Bin2]